MNMQQFPSGNLASKDGIRKRTLQPNSETSESIHKETFLCECGKKYLSFPALYVHARIKHNLKLSCKQKKETFQMMIQEGEVKKTFFLKNGKQNEFELFQSVEPKKNKVTNFLKESQIDILEMRNGLLLQQLLLNYKNDHPITCKNQILLGNFAQIVVKQFCKNEPLKISELPNYFNSFVIHSEARDTQSWGQSCSCLFTFYRWLFYKEFTKLVVIPEFMETKDS